MLPPEIAVRSLIGISSYLDDQNKRAVLQEALAVARAIADEEDRARMLAALGQMESADGDPGDQGREGSGCHAGEAGPSGEALAVAWEIKDEGAQAHTLVELALPGGPGPGGGALAVAREIKGLGAQAHTLAAWRPAWQCWVRWRRRWRWPARSGSKAPACRALAAWRLAWRF